MKIPSKLISLISGIQLFLLFFPFYIIFYQISNIFSAKFKFKQKQSKRQNIRALKKPY